MQFYCLKCRKNVNVPDSRVKYQTKNGRRMAMATCPVCGTRMSKFVPME